MKVVNSPYTKIINGTTQFVVPVFQRDYRWSESQCEQLWTDILLIAQDPTTRQHFLGSLVRVSIGDTSAAFTRWLLIDGQQRVTALTLLLASLRDHIRETNWHGSEEGPTAARLEASFLKNMNEEGARRPKLVLRRRDQETLHAILEPSELPANRPERIVENNEYFWEQVAQADLALRVAAHQTCKLQLSKRRRGAA